MLNLTKNDENEEQEKPNIPSIPHPIRLPCRIFRLKYCLTEVLEQPEQPGGRTPAFNVMAIRGQRHANSKQRTLLADVDVAPPNGTT